MSGWIWWVAAGAAVLALALCRRPLGALCRVAARSGLGLVFLWLVLGLLGVPGFALLLMTQWIGH